MIAETWRLVWGDRHFFSRDKISVTVFRKKVSIFIFTAKISDEIDQVFWIFTFFSQTLPIFTMLNVVYDPFLTRKPPVLLCSYFRAHPTTLLLKIFGGRMHGPTPTSSFGGTAPPVPPRSPPL